MYETTLKTLAATAALFMAACGGSGGGSTAGGGAASAPSIGALTDTGHLASVAQASGAMTMRTGQGPLGYANVAAVALDPQSGALYGVTQESPTGAAMLLRIDPTPGANGLASKPVVVGTLGDVGMPGTLAWHSGERMLYGVQAPGGLLHPGRLVRIDPATGEASFVGECEKVTTLTYDPVTDALYGTRAGSFQRIQPSSGASLEVFSQAGLLPDVTALGVDPTTGVFHAAHFDPTSAAGPRMLAIDLFGSVDDVAAVDEVIRDIEVHPTTGAMLALGSGGSILDLAQGAVEFSVTHRGNLGCELFDFSVDPVNGGYWGIDTENHLVKFRLDGECRTIGRVSVPTRQLVFDSVRGELWGIGSEFLFTSSDQYVYAIDTTTAEVRSTPVLAQVSIGTQFTHDWTNDIIWAISGANDVCLRLDPATGATTLASNAHGLDDVRGLAWDAWRGRLVAMTSNSVPGRRRIYSWEPNQSGVSQIEFSMDLGGAVLEPVAGTDAFLALGDDGDLLEVTLGTGGEVSTVGGVRDDFYFATTFVPTSGRIYAAAREEVYAIDPTSGATVPVGSTPSGDLARGLVWDEANAQLGFVMADEIRWTSANAPWNSPQSTPLGGRNLRQVAYDSTRDLFFLVGPDGTFTMARNAGGASFVQLDATPRLDVTGLTYRDGAAWATTEDQRLFRIDPATGEWVDVGRTAVGVRGLY